VLHDQHRGVEVGRQVAQDPRERRRRCGRPAELGLRSRARRTSFIPAIARTVETNRLTSSLDASSSGAGGVRSAAVAPASSALIVTPTWSASGCAVTMTIGVGTSRMIRRVASKPFSTGISMSITTTSGRCRCVASTAAWPSGTLATTSMPGWVPSSAARCSRTVGESSAINTRSGVSLM
jgi:hypothetical protein